MAAPSGTKWGSIAGGYGRIGIHVALTHTATVTTRVVTIWFWSKYSVDDSNNTLYWNNDATKATTSKGSVDINTTVDSGSGWSTSNQKKLKTYTWEVARGTSAKTYNCAAKLTGVDRVGATMSVSTSYTIPALASYKVTFNANGGTGAPSTQTKYYGKTLTLPSTIPTRSGYTFLGWGTSSDDLVATYSADGSYTSNSAITLYALWRKIITLRYNANGGSGNIGNEAVNVYNSTTNYTFKISSTKPTRAGYTFLGWSTSASATSATYSAGGSITLSSSTMLYAVWKINSYKLTVNPNGGKWNGSANSQPFTQNYKTTKSIPLPVWEGHTFNGWLLSGGGSIASTGAVATTYTFGTSDGTLTARWDTNDYVVSFDATTNGGIGSTNVIVEYGKAIGTLPVATRKNHTFLGWFTAPSGGTKITSSYKVTKNVTLYAQFEIDATAYANDENVWKEGVVFTNVNGTMKKGHAMVNVNGVWEDGICK